MTNQVVISIMYCCLIIISVLTIKQSKRIFNTYINHYTLFNLWWLFSIALTFDSPFYPAISIKSYLIFFVGMIAFNATVIFQKVVNLELKSEEKEYYFNIKHRRIVEVFVIICLLPMIISNIKRLSQGDAYWLLRSDYIDRDTSYLREFIMAYFCAPLSSLLYVTAFYKYYSNIGKYSYRMNMAISILIVALNCFASGGRSVVINFVMLYIVMGFSYLVPYYKRILNQHAKFNPTLLIIPGFIIVFMSVSRNLLTEDNNLFKLIQFSFGLYGGLFDYHMQDYYTSPLANTTYGLSTFEGLYLLINYPIKIFFGTNIFNDYSIVDDTIQQFVRLPASEWPYEVNAFVSMYYRFLRDWGYFGVIVGPILLSCLFNYAFRIAARKQVHLLFYFILLMNLRSTTIDSPYSSVSFMVLIIWYNIIIKCFANVKTVTFHNNTSV